MPQDIPLAEQPGRLTERPGQLTEQPGLLAEPAAEPAEPSAWATYARDDALDYGVTEQSQDVFEFNVTGCRYAEFCKELGEPELGFLLVCSADFPLAEGLGSDVQLMRTQTIMQGATHCDFRYRRLREID